MRVFELFNALLLAFAPTPVFPVLRTLGLLEMSAEDLARLNWRPEDDVNAGANPYRVWMEARGLDARTVARRMNLDEQYVINVFMTESLAKHVPYLTPQTINAFCSAVDITPLQLASTRAPVRADILEATVVYNRQISCGFDRVTDGLLSIYKSAERMGLMTGGTGILETCEAVYLKAGHRVPITDGSVDSEFKKIGAMITGAAAYVRACRDGTGPLPFAIYASYGDDDEALPAFSSGEYGAGIVYADTDKNQRQAACNAWLTALEAWLLKPETDLFLKTAANARYIKSQRFGLKYDVPREALTVGCP